MKCREYQCDYKNVLPYFTSLEENVAQLLQALWQSHRLAFGFEKAMLALFLCSKHFKTCHAKLETFLPFVSSPDITTESTQKKKIPFPKHL